MDDAERLELTTVEEWSAWLRDHHPLYYVEKWDTYAVSRFADVWDVLEINDGTFVASE